MCRIFSLRETRQSRSRPSAASICSPPSLTIAVETIGSESETGSELVSQSAEFVQGKGRDYHTNGSLLHGLMNRTINSVGKIND